ncbi:hypothetical protein FFJ24_005730 [Pedobacter sp. KBS0701]|uniref:hypothetical protein n=1 Tax=Pedobacter sp. KBS0701 TaxID=2578106 RepID=UPI00110EBB76|nr:hypothetical protein [Pedobacter sp. KBS0701]QDW24351.1 hypothetical protein FFJ24_005730 [Pedobacter sp. KBS0701]
MHQINSSKPNTVSYRFNIFIVKHATLISVILLGYFIWWWVYKIDLLPGLHADEAWFGLEAIKIKKTGVTSLTGMTAYTGILQQLINAVSFRIFGIGVIQLRITTVFFNLVGLGIIYQVLYSVRRVSSVVLLLMLAQSVLFITASRIAWEVNTFHLFFFSISFLSIMRMIREGEQRTVWQHAFLIANMLGAYNHIIFSSLVLSLFLGLLFYTTVSKDRAYMRIIFLCICSIFNTAILLCAFKYIPNVIGKADPLMLLGCMIILITYQVRIIQNMELKRLVLKTTALKYFVASFGMFGLLLFLIHHGLAFFQFISNLKTFESIYGLAPNALFEFSYSICAIVFIIYLLDSLFRHLKKRSILSPFASVVIFYFVVFTFYTTANSLRYYILIYFLCTTYLSLEVGKLRRVHYPLLLTVLTMILMNSYLLIRIYSRSKDQVAAVTVSIGNNQKENSGHFLPNKPLIDFLKENKVSKIKTITNDYFIQLPVTFYEQASPWNKVENNHAVIDYNSNPNSNGFDMVLVKLP